MTSSMWHGRWVRHRGTLYRSLFQKQRSDDGEGDDSSARMRSLAGAVQWGVCGGGA